MNTRKQIALAVGIVLLAVAGVGLHVMTRTEQSSADAMGGHDHAAMMAAAGSESRPVHLDAEQARRIGVSYATVEYGPMESTVRVVGIVGYDETRLVTVSPKLEGWVEKLYVDFTGAPVQRGQPLLALYSPLLVSAQEELLLARRLADAAAGEASAERARDLLASARRRLEYWDIAPDQIAAIETRGAPEKALVLRSPATGLVVEKEVFEGSRVEPGKKLYTIADLSRVWVEGEVFERELALVRTGQKAEITFDAFPGRTFEGVVTYVLPTLSAESRTGRIRVELANPEHQLRPGMYGNLAFHVPIHHEGVHIPRTAVLITGTRALVFVRTADGALTPREITVGQAAGDHVEVLAGLEPGEVVVAAASFLVDAESNLGMAMEGMGADSGGTAPPDTGHAGHRMEH